MSNSQTEFYKSIANYYDDIFPLKKEMLEFTKTFLTADSYLLDVGCGTGNLAIAASTFCQQATGFDLDKKMIKIAQKKAKKIRNAHFQCADILKMEEHFPAGNYTMISCYGNTLVHLLTKEKIQSFLHQAYKLLNTNGLLALQILNYDYILSRQISTLPLIENDNIIFIREYDIKDESRIIDFRTTLKIKENEETIENVSQLYALLPDELEELLQTAGFRDVSMYSSFKEEPLSNDKLPLVVKAQKA